jgi:hypothetical protein
MRNLDKEMSGCYPRRQENTLITITIKRLQNGQYTLAQSGLGTDKNIPAENSERPFDKQKDLRTTLASIFDAITEMDYKREELIKSLRKLVDDQGLPHPVREAAENELRKYEPDAMLAP